MNTAQSTDLWLHNYFWSSLGSFMSSPLTYHCQLHIHLLTAPYTLSHTFILQPILYTLTYRVFIFIPLSEVNTVNTDHTVCSVFIPLTFIPHYVYSIFNCVNWLHYSALHGFLLFFWFDAKLHFVVLVPVFCAMTKKIQCNLIFLGGRTADWRHRVATINLSGCMIFNFISGVNQSPWSLQVK